MTGPEIPAVRISSPSELVAMIPALLGFTPRDSVVVICVQRWRRRLGLVLRYDLDVEQDTHAFAAEVVDRVELEAADGVFVVVFSDVPLPAGDLPHRALIDVLGLWLDELVLDFFLVHEGRWWMYDEPDLPGVPFDGSSSAVMAISAVNALSGRGPLPDREAVVASLALALDAGERKAMGRAIADELHRHRQVAQISRRIAVRELADRLTAALADPRRRLSDSEVAELAAFLQDVVVRDEVLVRAADCTERDALRPVLQAVLCRTPAPYDAPVATSLAWVAYASGDGITANVALDRALASDPDYRFARLIVDALHRQVAPDRLEQVMRDAGEDMSGAHEWDASA